MAWASIGETRYRMEIVCPSCRRPAEFCRAHALQLRDADLARRVSGLRDVTVMISTDETPQALYRHGLGARPIDALIELTEAERQSLKLGAPWPPLYDEGSCLCPACGYRRPHRVNWPTEAFYQIEHKGQALWAWNSDWARALVDYISAPDAKEFLAQSPFKDFLKRVPTHFLTAQNREAVVKKLRKRIDEGAP